MSEGLEEKEVSKVFNNLNHINVNEHTKNKNGLTYLSWAWAWGEVKKEYPLADYEIKKFGEEEKPYLFDDDLGYMVFTTVTIQGLTHEMWLPVMDNRNNAMSNKNQKITKFKKEVTVQKATMFDVNSAIMRCLTKNLAMFGLGLYIYAGEDLPEAPPVETVTNKQADDLAKKIKELSKYLEDKDAERKTTFWLVGKFSQGGEILADIEKAKFDEATDALNKMIENNKPKVEATVEPTQESLLEGNTTKAKG